MGDSMKLQSIFLAVAALTIAASVTAQTTYSGVAECEKPETEYRIDVPGRSDHAFSVSQGRCVHTKPGEIAGIKHKDEVFTESNEIIGDTLRWNGFNVVTMANGDELYLRLEGTSSLKDGVPVSGECKWRYVGGTGKFANIKGNGTSKGKFAADGTSTWEYKGEYVLP
jgi:hypothetical protein